MAGGLTALGAILAVGQIAAIRPSWLIATADAIGALQLHLTITGLGLASIAGILAAHAFMAQQRELSAAEKQLRIAEEEISALRKTPNIVISWAIQQRPEIQVNDDLATVTIRVGVNSGAAYGGLPLMVALGNNGERLASIYEIAFHIPAALGQLIQCSEVYRDRYVGKPIRYHVLERAEGYLYSFVVNQDLEFVLPPHSTPLEVALLKVNTNPNGPLQNFPSGSPIWGVPQDIAVEVNGDWGSQPQQSLRFRLTRQD